ncbi:MAG: STAS domain-containing protein [Desulfovibrio sp.]|uniref:STAS domain-containing protein n=1 Tax=Desulfovibrio sp. 7SRBS1 TaxID=3378064 RepID=UPI003B425174
MDEMYGKIPVIKLDGRVVSDNAPDVKKRIQDRLTEGYLNLVLDMSNVPFIDSSGLGTLVASFRTVGAKGGVLLIAGLIPEVRALFQLTRLDKVFEIYETVDQAVESLQD